MTLRELFAAFYRAARLDAKAGKANPHRRELIVIIARDWGFTEVQINRCRIAALLAWMNSALPAREPSRNSVAIQLSIHTFGRVTRGHP
ncbi:hypothetical protein ACU6RQ_12510 [Zobellella denitrificans]